MQHDALPHTARIENWAGRIPAVWRVALVQVGLVWLGLAALFAGDWAAMADQWWNSSTYNHIVLIPAIIAWLVWLRVGELGKLRPQAWWPGLFFVGGALFVWVLGSISGLNVARQLGAVLMLQGAAITLLGPQVIAGVLFPLSYMLFLVRFGDELIPALQTITARLTVAVTHLSGIKADIDGVFINTPVGLFEVAEACSGVKFLIAMVALAVLVAHVCFRSWSRRTAFFAIAVVLPVLANGVRAWGTIYIAQFRGIAFAEGFDHIFYGWIFFAFVMILLLAGAWRFFDRAANDALIDAQTLERSRVLKWLLRFRINGWVGAVSIGTMAVMALLWGARADALAAPVPAQISLPPVAGWHLVEYKPDLWWEPRAKGADRKLLGRYRDAEGHQVDVFYALYSQQKDGKKAGAFGEGALTPDTAWRWLKPGPNIAGANSEYLFAEGHIHRLTATYYRTGNLLTGSNGKLKLANMLDKLFGRARPTAMLILSSEESGGHSAQDNIAAFRTSAGPTGAWMDGIAQLP